MSALQQSFALNHSVLNVNNYCIVELMSEVFSQIKEVNSRSIITFIHFPLGSLMRFENKPPLAAMHMNSKTAQKRTQKEKPSNITELTNDKF